MPGSPSVTYVDSASDIGGGSSAWDNLGYLYAEDTNVAGAPTFVSSAYANTIECAFSGISVPSGSNIDGISVRLVCRAQVKGGTPNFPIYCYLYYNSTEYGTGSAPPAIASNTLTSYYAGGSSSLWSKGSWTTTELGSTLLHVKILNSSGVAGAVEIDVIEVSVYYSEASGASFLQMFY